MPTNATLALPIGQGPRVGRVAPISLVSRAEPFDDPAWLFEPRYEGYRALLQGSDQGCRIEVVGDVAPQIQDLRERVSQVLGCRDAILDGQIVALDRQGKPGLQHLLRGDGYRAFAAWDLLWLDGADLRDLPLEIRKQQLAELLPEDTGPLYKVLTIAEHGRALFGAIKRLDLAGIVAKCRHDPYRAATVWYEIRNPARSVSSDGRPEVFHPRPRQRHPSRER